MNDESCASSSIPPLAYNIHRTQAVNKPRKRRRANIPDPGFAAPVKAAGVGLTVLEVRFPDEVLLEPPGVYGVS